MNKNYKYTLFLFFYLYSSLAFASGPNFNDTTNQPLTNSISPNFSVNVGINSASPGQKLDVQGTIRTTNLTMSGQSPISGYVLTASDSAGDTTWSSAGGVSGWTVTNTTDVYETKSGNVGIGTTLTSTAALSVMNGNVGIGTWVPKGTLDVEGTLSSTIFKGNVGIGTTFIGGSGEGALTIMDGNVGIGTWVPATSLNVNGTGTFTNTIVGNNTLDSATAMISDSNRTLFGVTQSAVLKLLGSTAGVQNMIFADNNSNLGRTGVIISNSSEGNGWQNDFFQFLVHGPSYASNLFLTSLPGKTSDAEWVIGGAQSNDNTMLGFGFGTFGTIPLVLMTNNTSAVYIDSSQNVGIGTSLTNSRLSVMGGNVGIGTWNPSTLFEVAKQKFDVTSSGNVGIGSISPGQALDVQGTVRATAFVGNGSALTNITGTQWTTTNTNDIYLPNNGNVGLGTTLTSTAALTVMNGNVGIGTWVPADLLQVGKFSSSTGGFEVDSSGNVGMGTTITSNAPLSIMNGNVGIGTWVPMSNLEVSGLNNKIPSSNHAVGIVFDGTVTDTTNGNFVAGIISTPIYGTSNTAITDVIGYYTIPGTVGTSGAITRSYGMYVDTNTVVDTTSYGIKIVSPTGGTTSNYGILTSGSGWNSFGGNVGISSTTPGQALDVQGTVRVLGGGNVGIGTSLTSTAGLTVMTGNVGIGTWVPAEALQVNNTLGYQSMYSNGSSGTSFTVNWNNGNLQKITMSGNCVFTFTAPGSPARLSLELVQDSSGSRTAAWPAAVKWSGGGAPTLTSTLTTGTDLVSCLYDGTNYLCSADLDLR